MHTFKSLAIGDTIFVPKVSFKDVAVTCPDCLGDKVWNVTTPSGIDLTVECPRCGGGQNSWMIPKRHEQTLEIAEAKVSEISIRCHARHSDGQPHTSIDYSTAPYIGHVSGDRVFITRDDALAAGAAMMAEHAAKEDARWREERERVAKRAGQDIVTVIEAKANERYKALNSKLDRLREKMLEAVRYPTIDGPKISTRSYSSGEITSQALADWLSNLLSEADLDGWSEEDLHEALCQC